MSRSAPSVVAAVFLCAAASSSALAQFNVTAGATARYQGAPFQSGFQSVSNPPAMLGDVAVASALSDPANDGFSFASGEARFSLDALGGYARNLARASGYAPHFGPPNEVYATSDVSATVEYRVTSPTTPVGTPIEIRTVLAYTGQLGVANYFGATNPGELTATFASSFTIDGVPYFDASATLEQRFPNSVSGPIFSFTGPWGGSWVSSVEQVPGLGDYNAYTTSYADVVVFNTVMASDFDVVFSQSASANIPGPFEAFAASNFLHTGRFSFEVFDAATGQQIADAVVDVVPAPATALLALALPAMPARRRRD